MIPTRRALASNVDACLLLLYPNGWPDGAESKDKIYDPKDLGRAEDSLGVFPFNSIERFSPVCEGWFRKCMKKLASLRQLGKNWNGYGSEPPSNKTLRWVEEVLEKLHDLHFAPDRVVASAENGVGIIFHRNEKYADIECLNSGKMSAVTFVGQEEPTVWELDETEYDLDQCLERIRNFIES